MLFRSSVETVKIAVRPEELSIVTEEVSGSDFTSIPGTIEKSSFIGAIIRYVVDCGSNLMLMVELHKPQSEALMSNGTSVFVKIPADSILHFHPETGVRI